MLASFAMIFPCIVHANSSDADVTNSLEDQRLPGEDMQPPDHSESESPDVNDKNLLLAIEQLSPRSDRLSEVYPLNLDSPRGTLWSMLVLLDNYQELLETNGRTLQNQDHLNWIQKRITKCFDIADIAPNFRSSVATDAAVRLRSLILRTPMLGWYSIPDEQDIEESKLNEYRFKNIPIVMTKVTTGERNGQWLISRDTRDIAEDALGHLMNTKSGAGPLGLRTFTNDDDSLYKNHFFQSGWMIPSKIIMDLPDFAGMQIIGQSLWKWALAFIFGVIITAIIVVTYLTFIRRMKSKDTPQDKHPLRHDIVRIAYQLMIGCLMIVFQIFIKNQIFLDGTVLETLFIVTTLIMALAFIGAMFSTSNACSEIILRSKKKSSGAHDESIRILIKTATVIFALVFLFQILQGLGFTPTTILAGAGVTGLALALAAQDMLKNFFASVILLIEKPFKNGDYILFKKHAGTVKMIGMRSTTLMSSDGNLIYVPNCEFAQGEIENISHRPHIRSRITIGMTYSTNYKRMTVAMDILEKILKEKVQSPEGENPSVFFKSFDESSLTLQASVIHKDPSGFNSRQVLSEVNLEILRQFNEEKLEFAYPTISIDMSKSDGDTRNK